jgi:hypothetical protein
MYWYRLKIKWDYKKKVSVVRFFCLDSCKLWNNSTGACLLPVVIVALRLLTENIPTMHYEERFFAVIKITI